MTDKKAKISDVLKSMSNNLKKEFIDTIFFVNSDRLVFYKCIFLVLLIFCSFLVPIFAYITLGVALLFTITETKSKAIYYLVFLLPFYNVFRFDTDQLYFSVWILLCFVLIQAIRLLIDFCTKRKKINWIVTSVFIVACVYLILPIGPFKLANLLPIISLLAVLYLLFYYFDEISFKNLTLYLFYGILIAAIFSLFIDIIPRLGEMVVRFNSYSSTDYRFQGLSRDPNYYAMEVLLCLTCFTCLYLHKKINLFFYPIYIFLMCLGVLTGSKSFLIVFIAFVVLFTAILIYKVVKNKALRNKKSIINCIAVLVCFVLPFGVCYKNTGYLIDRIIHPSYFGVIDFGNKDNGETSNNEIGSDGVSSDQIINDGSSVSENNPPSEQESRLNSLTTGRSQIWKYYLNECTKSAKQILFGAGIGSGYLGTEYEIAIHNTAIQCVYFLGLCGCLIFVALALIYIWQLKRFKKNCIINFFIPLFIVLAMMCSLDNLFSYRLFILVTLLIYSLVEQDQLDVVDQSKYNEDIVSVIVPVYKVEKYLDRCVESIVNQNYKNLEIILVDDGSPDNCPEMCDEWAKKDTRIKVIHKENGGLSDARNAGIKIATGRYLVFVDSDDYIDQNFSSVLKKVRGADFSILNSYWLNNVGNEKNNTISNIEGIISTQYLIDIIDVNSKINSACMKICNREFIIKNNLYFDVGILYEDMVWTMKTLNIIGIVNMINDSYYHYVISRQGSIMNSTTIKSFDNMFSNANGLMQLYSDKHTKTRYFVQDCLTHNIFSLCRRVKFLNENDKNKVYQLIKDYRYFSIYDFKTFVLNVSFRIFGPKFTCKLLGLLI